MAQELDFTDPEHAAGSTMAAFALAQLSFSILVRHELIAKAEAEKMLKRLIKANEGGGTVNEVAAALLAIVLLGRLTHHEPSQGRCGVFCGGCFQQH
jgi:hypothetical protein